MVAPVAYAVGAGLWTAGRWAVFTAAPFVIKAGVSGAKSCWNACGRMFSRQGAQIVAREGAEESVQTTAKAAARGLSALDRLALNGAKISTVLSIATAGFIAEEVLLDGALSKAAPHVIVAVSDAVRAVSPELAEIVKENGIGALAFVGDVTSSVRDAAVNAAAGTLELEGNVEGSIALQMGNVTLNPAGLGLAMAGAPEGERASAAIKHIQNKVNIAGKPITNEQLRDYLNKNPHQRDALRLVFEQGGIKVADIPELKGVNWDVQAPATNAPALTGSFMTAADVALDAKIAATKVFYIGPGLTAAYNRVCALTKDPERGIKLGAAFDWASTVADWNIPIISTIARSFAVGMAASPMQERLENLKTDLQNGDTVSMTTGATDHNGEPAVSANRYNPTGPGYAFGLA